MTTRDYFKPAGLSIPQNVPDKITAYQNAALMIEEAYKMLDEAETILKTAFVALPDGAYTTSYDFGTYTDGNHRGPKEVFTRIRRAAWSHLIDMLEIRKVMSIQKAEELSKQLHDGEMPEITMENVRETLAAFVGNANTLAQEAVREVFDILRPASNADLSNNRPWMKRYYLKTNLKNGRFHVGKKIILSGYIRNEYGGRFHINYYHDSHLRAIDRVFHLMDGKGNPKGYGGPLIDAINTCQGYGETEYFRFRCYQNGNLHLEFRRLDLLKVLNKTAAGMELSTEKEREL